jgi:hypothetical protein
METPISWRCPFCHQNATITPDRHSTSVHRFDNGNRHGAQSFVSEALVCPNADCGEFSLTAQLSNAHWNGHELVDDAPERTWRLVPPATVKRFPEYVPDFVRSDYEEACLTQESSPKASAMLARRCLQAMIRHRWSLRKATLSQEIDAIKGDVDKLAWDAIDAVREIGNIGAHMSLENDELVDVEPQEAALLVGLIETLITDWYVDKHDREERMNRLIAAASSKDPVRWSRRHP